MSAHDKYLERYPVPASNASNPFVTRLEVRKSLFVTSTARCESAGDARAFVQQIRMAAPDASHHCWAFVSGAPGDSSRIGFSDDGEPHGTAGRPILNVLMHCGTGQICTVVSRWFGGIKLGTGGLARAYQQASLENVEALPREEKASRQFFNLALDYSAITSFRRLLSDSEGQIEREEYGKDVKFLFSIPADRVAEARARLCELSSGQLKLEEVMQQAERGSP